MIKVVKVPIKPSKQQTEYQKIASQFHYIKELSLMKYDAEEKREQNLIQQSSQMQTAFSFMTAAVFMALPICIENRGVLSLHIYYFLFLDCKSNSSLTCSMALEIRIYTRHFCTQGCNS